MRVVTGWAPPWTGRRVLSPSVRAPGGSCSWHRASLGGRGGAARVPFTPWASAPSMWNGVKTILTGGAQEPRGEPVQAAHPDPGEPPGL